LNTSRRRTTPSKTCLSHTGSFLAAALLLIACEPTDVFDLDDEGEESADAGTLGSLLPPTTQDAGTSSQGASDAGSKSQSSLCYGITSSTAGQNLELKCTPDNTLSCAALELKETRYVYSSWSKCSADARNVLSYWTRTGELGGASPDVRASSTDAGSSASDAGRATSSGSCKGSGTLKVTVTSGCWWVKIELVDASMCGVTSWNYIPNHKMCSTGASGSWGPTGNSVRYWFCPFRTGDTSAAQCTGRSGTRSGTWTPSFHGDDITFSLVHPEVRACFDGALCMSDPLPPGAGLPPATNYD
jgi:hypothetical protein